jgi:hypothetical protein
LTLLPHLQVWIWGELGGTRYDAPSMVTRLRDATVVSIACGAEHVAMVTGDPATIMQQTETVSMEDVRADAISRQQESYEQRQCANDLT